MAMYKNLECRRNGTDLTFESRRNGRVTGRFAPKPVPPGTIRSKTIFRTGRFTPGRFAPFVKHEIKAFLRNENRF